MDIGSIGRFFSRLFRQPRARPEAILIAIGGVLIILTVAGELLLALGLAH
jgi:hypothetical protein